MLPMPQTHNTNGRLAFTRAVVRTGKTSVRIPRGAVLTLGILTLILGVGFQKPGDKPADRPPPERTDKPQEEVPMTITIKSPAFAHNAAIPKKFTGDGEDVSPELSWSGVPDNAKELALICDDPDAPTPEPWVHWVIYKIPVKTTKLPENVAKTETLKDPAGAVQGKNSWSKLGYGGPAPPRGHGVHHYHFKVYALDAPLTASAGPDKQGLLAAMKGHILAQGELIGTYQR